MHPADHRRERDRGQSSVEFALVLPLAVVIAWSTVAVAWVGARHLEVAHVARVAVRAAVVDATPSAARRAALEATDLSPLSVEVREAAGTVSVRVTVTLALPLPLPTAMRPRVPLTEEASMAREG